MYVRMMFSVGVALLVTLLLPSSTTALDQDRDKANDLIFFIKSRSYKAAAYLTERAFNKTMQKVMDYVVHEVYIGRKANIDLILEYVDSNYTGDAAAVSALNSLIREMNAKNHTDFLLKLRALGSLIDRNSIVPHEELDRDLNDSVKKPLEKELINAMKSLDNAKIYNISEFLHDNAPLVFKVLIKTALEKTFDDINFYYLLHVFDEIKHISQRVWFYSAMIDELKKSFSFKSFINKRDLDQSELVLLAYGLGQASKAYDKYEYDNMSKLDRDANTEAKRLRWKLPYSVNDLAFSDYVCILNEKSGDEMHGAFDSKRTVFTSEWEVRFRDKWIIEREGDSFFIINGREYLYAPSENASNNRKLSTKVHTKIYGEIPKQHNSHKWIFEPIGDAVYIKNEGQNQYLDVGEKYDGERRYVTINSDMKKNLPNSKWLIQDCSFM